MQLNFDIFNTVLDINFFRYVKFCFYGKLICNVCSTCSPQEADKIGKELIEEEDRRKEKTERNKRKKKVNLCNNR